MKIAHWNYANICSATLSLRYLSWVFALFLLCLPQIASAQTVEVTTTELLGDPSGSYDGTNTASFPDAGGGGVDITINKIGGSSQDAGGVSAPLYAAPFTDPVRGVWLGSDDRFPAKFTGTALDSEQYTMVFSEPVTDFSFAVAALNFNIDGDERIQIDAILDSTGADITAGTTFSFTADSGDVIYDTALRQIRGGTSYTAEGNDGGTLEVANSSGILQMTFSRIEVDNTASTNPTPGGENRSNGITLGPIFYETPSVTPVARPQLTPASCGASISEGFLIQPGLSISAGGAGNDTSTTFGDGGPRDALEFADIARNIAGEYEFFIEGDADSVLTGTAIGDGLDAELSSASNGSASELWRSTTRLDGTPGSSGSVQIQSGFRQEYIAYWVKDLAGNVLDSADFIITSTSDGPGENGVEDIDITFTFPADGAVYLNFAMWDGALFHDVSAIGNFTCPSVFAGSEDDREVGFSDEDQVVGNVLDEDNDTIDGDPAVADDNVVLTVEAIDDELELDTTTGEITVLADTPPGTYTVEYRITDPDDAGNFATATETIIVRALPEADDDSSLDNDIGDDVTVDIVDGDTATDGTIEIDTVNLIAPTGLTVTEVTDADGDVIGLEVDGEGVWSYDDTSGEIEFVPDGSLIGDPTPITYTIEDSNELTSEPATITVTYVGPTARDPLVPATCGAYIAEGFITDGFGIGTEAAYDLSPGTPETNFFLPSFQRLSTGEVEIYFEGTPDASSSGEFASATYSNLTAVSGNAADQTDAAEVWRTTARIDGLPGETLNFDTTNGTRFELLTYWVTDSSGNIITSNPTNGGGTGWWRGWATGDGTTFPISYTVPSGGDGLTYLNIVVLDPQANWGPIQTEGYECPEAALELTKSASSTLSTPVAVGDTIDFTFTVENTGTVALDQAATLPTDTMTYGTDGTGAAVDVPLVITRAATSVDDNDGILAAGEIITYEATYTLDQAAIDAGGVHNTATSDGDPVDATTGNPLALDPPAVDTSDNDTTGDGVDGVDDDSDGDGDPDTSNPTVVTLDPTPDLTLVKSAAATLSTPITVGDTIDFTFTVENTGNLALDQAATLPTDTMTYGTDGTGAAVDVPLVITRAATSADDNDGILAIGEIITYEGTYTLDQAAIDAGGVHNTAVSAGDPVDSVTGDPLTGVDSVEDTSDNDAAGDGTDGVDDDSDGDGDPDTSNPTVVTLDPTPDLTLVKSAAATLSTPIAVGDTIDFTFTVENTGNLALDQAATLPTDTMTYGTDGTGAAVDVPLVITRAATSADDNDGILAIDEIITYEGTYTLDQAAIDAGGVHNTATSAGDPVDSVTGDPLTGVDSVEDTSDNDATGDGTDGVDDDSDGDGDPDTSNPTVVTLDPTPDLTLVKSAAATLSTPIAVGDTIDFTFTVENTGNLALDQAATLPTDTMTYGTDGTGAAVDVPLVITRAATSADDNDGILAIGEIITYEGTYTLDQAAIDAGGVHNTAVSAGDPVDSVTGDPLADVPSVEATSDNDTTGDGIDGVDDNSDGDDDPTTSNPTVVALDQVSSLQLTKTVDEIVDVNGNGFTDEGDEVTWTFRVENTGNVSLTGIEITDSIATVSGGPIDLDAGDFDDTTFTASYTIDADDVAAGGVENTAEAEGFDPSGDPVTDVSDTGDGDETTNDDDLGEPGDPNGTGDDDGDPTNDPTVALFAPVADLSVIKSVSNVDDTNGNGQIDEGDVITYAFVVSNTGNVALEGVSLTDNDATVSGGPIDLAIGASDSTTFTATHALTDVDVANGGFENTARATGTAVDASGDPIDLGGSPLTATDDSDAGTEAQLDSDGNPVAVTDPEDTETEDLSGGTNGTTDDDPTVFFIPTPEITFVKTVGRVLDSNGDGVFGDEGDEIEYEFVVSNTGNTDLTGITIDDDLIDVDGGPIDLAIGESDSVTFTGTYVVTADDIDAGYVENTASASGEAALDGDPIFGPDGEPITTTDVSDSGTNADGSDVTDPETTETSDGEGDIDGDPTNDPTVISVPATALPALEVVKSITAIVDEDGSDTLTTGDTLTYTFTVTNTGNVDLVDVTVSDDRVAVAGSLSLAVGESGTLTASTTITAAEVEQGYVENTATAEGLAVNSAGDPILDPDSGEQLSASDTSDAGTDATVDAGGTPTAISDPAATETPDGDGVTNGDATDDPTVLLIPAPGISVVKSVETVADTNGDGLFGGEDDVITYTFVVTNTGNTPLSNVSVTDPTATVSGGPIDLAVGETNTSAFTATKTVTDDDITAGYVENEATAEGDAVDEDGNPILNLAGDPLSVTDDSDAGTDETGADITDPEGTETPDGEGNTDGQTDNDPTVVSVPANAEPEVSLIKSVFDVLDANDDGVLGNADDVVTYTFTVTNTGNVDLADVEVTDTLLGGVIATLPTLAVGETTTLVDTYTLTDVEEDQGYVENTASVEGQAVNSSGGPLLDPDTGAPITATDTSDSGTSSDATDLADPEAVETPDGSGETDGDPTNDPTVFVLQPSDAAISGLVFVDNNPADSESEDSDGADSDPEFVPGVDSGLSGYIVTLTNADGEELATTTSAADGTYLLEGFPIGTGYTLTFTDPESGEEIGSIEDLNFEDNLTYAEVDLAVARDIVPGLSLTKVALVDDVIIGQTVPYEIEAISTDGTAYGPVDVVDTLPSGLVYTPGTATVDGDVVEPDVSGNTLRFADLTVPADGSILITLNARVAGSATVGELTNSAEILDENGVALTETATATVTLTPEAVFDCSAVIGKVFDDRNMNGYQDQYGENAVSTRGVLTDQNVFTGKIGNEIAVVDQGEPGIPGVRLVTPTGTIITTDEYGRYSVPCAELPDSTGINFSLKLDTRSLPTGYRVTTENPRTMRLTAGIFTEMNFAASIGRVVDVDLTAAAFLPGTATPVDRLDTGLGRLLEQVKDTPSLMRLSYFETGGEDQALVRQRMNAVEDLIRERWRGIGRYRLVIERTSMRLQ